MVSQPDSQCSQGGPVLLELAKYSYATVPMSSVAPVPWIHISNTSSLIAYFETRRSFGTEGAIDEKSIFKVLKDPEVMEELDLRALGREARRALEASKDAMQHTMDHNVAVIIRLPVIAMKYPRNEREVRRFQIRFQSNEGFYEAMKMLSRASVPTVEAGTFPARRPQTPTSCRSPSSATPTYHDPFAARPATATSLATITSAPAAFLRPITSTALMPPPSHFSTTSKTVPATSPYFEHEPNIVPADDVSHPIVSGIRSSTASTPVTRVPPREYVSLDRTKKPADDVISSRETHQDSISFVSQQKPTIGLCNPRPATAPDRSSQHLSQILPPRRDLPFETKQKLAPLREPLKELRNGRRYSVAPSSAERGRGDDENAMQLDTSRESQDSSQSAKKKRRTPARPSTKQDAPKKLRATKKPAPKPAPRTTRATAPVPVVEELSNRNETPVESASIMDDTQALLERAAASLRGRSTINTLEVPKSPVTEASNSQRDLIAVRPQELVGTMGQVEPRLPARGNLEKSTSKLVCTLATPDMDLPTLAAPEELIATSNMKLTTIPERSASNVKTVSVTESHGDSTLTTAPTTYSTSTTPASIPVPVPIPTLQSPNTQFSHTYNHLLSRPEFASSNNKLNDWLHQPKELRTKAMQKFFCDAYQNPGFHELCKELHGDWKAAIIWPEALRYPDLVERVDDEDR